MVRKLNILTLVALTGLVIPVIANAQETQTAKVEVKLASEIQWQKLNPARGDASPQAGTICGDWRDCGRNQTGSRSDSNVV